MFFTQREVTREETLQADTDEMTFVTISSVNSLVLEVHELSASEVNDHDLAPDGADIIDLNVSEHDTSSTASSADTVETLLDEIASLSTLGSFQEESWAPTAVPIVHKLHLIRRFLRSSLRHMFQPLAAPVVSSPRPIVS